MKSCKLKNVLISITIGCLVMFWLDLIWLQLMEFPPFVAFIFQGIIGLVLACLLTSNLVLALRRVEQWKLHTVTGLLIILTLCGSFLLGTWAARSHRQWFFNTGIHNYELIIDKILNNNATFVNGRPVLDGLPSNSIINLTHIWGRTNADGSMTVEFSYPNNVRGHGYLYYSGIELIVKPGEMDKYIFPNNPDDHPYRHLTNNWYEF